MEQGREGPQRWRLLRVKLRAKSLYAEAENRLRMQKKGRHSPRPFARARGISSSESEDILK
jgi:hypothetical protein